MRLPQLIHSSLLCTSTKDSLTGLVAFRFRVAHGAVQPFGQRPTCPTFVTSRLCIVQSWSSNPLISDATKPSSSTVWYGEGLRLQGLRYLGLMTDGLGYIGVGDTSRTPISTNPHQRTKSPNLTCQIHPGRRLHVHLFDLICTRR